MHGVVDYPIGRTLALLATPGSSLELSRWDSYVASQEWSHLCCCGGVRQRLSTKPGWG